MVDQTPEDAAFAVVAPADGRMLANDRVTPEQVASAVRVRHRAIDSENAAHREAKMKVDGAARPARDH